METWMIVLLALCGIFNYAAGETARGWIKKTVDDSFWIVVCAVLSPAGSIFAFEYLATDDCSPGDEGMVPTVILLEIIQLGLLALVGFRLLGIENMAILFASFAAGYLRGYAFDLIGRLVKKIFSAFGWLADKTMFWKRGNRGKLKKARKALKKMEKALNGEMTRELNQARMIVEDTMPRFFRHIQRIDAVLALKLSQGAFSNPENLREVFEAEERLRQMRAETQARIDEIPERLNCLSARMALNLLSGANAPAEDFVIREFSLMNENVDAMEEELEEVTAALRG